MCASHLLRIVDNRAAKRNNKPRSNCLARYGAWPTLLLASQRSPAVRF
ncbi:MAG: hypothetical protein QOF94_1129 [Acidobacteriaceae bacterium]|jgi:hypothetical protein